MWKNIFIETLVSDYITITIYNWCVFVLCCTEAVSNPMEMCFTLCNYFVTTVRVYYIDDPNFKRRNTRTYGFINNKVAIKGWNVSRHLILLLLLRCCCCHVRQCFHTLVKVVFRHACRDPWRRRATEARGIARERYRNTDRQQHILSTWITRAPLASCWR